MKNNLLIKFNIFLNLFKGESTRKISGLVLSLVIAQVLSFLLMPVITRMYPKEVIGEFQIALSFITVLLPISSLMYENTLVISADYNEKRSIIQISIFLSVFFTICLFAYLFVQRRYDIDVKILSLIQSNIILILIVVFFFIRSIDKIFQQIYIDNNKYKLIGILSILNITLPKIFVILAGFIENNLQNYIISTIIGYLIVILIGMKNINWAKYDIRQISNNQIKKVMTKYKKMPIFKTVTIFINSLTLQLPVFYIASSLNSIDVASYSVANRLVNIPLSLFAMALNKVYYKKAADAYNKDSENLLKIYNSFILKGFILAGISSLGLIFLAAPVVKFLFGKEYIDSIYIIQLLSINMLFRTICNPVGGSFDILNKQEIGLILSIVFLFIRIVLFTLLNNNLKQLVWSISISAVFYYPLFLIILRKYIKDKLKNA